MKNSHVKRQDLGRARVLRVRDLESVIGGGTPLPSIRGLAPAPDVPRTNGTPLPA